MFGRALLLIARVAQRVKRWTTNTPFVDRCAERESSNTCGARFWTTSYKRPNSSHCAVATTQLTSHRILKDAGAMLLDGMSVREIAETKKICILNTTHTASKRLFDVRSRNGRRHSARARIALWGKSRAARAFFACLTEWTPSIYGCDMHTLTHTYTHSRFVELHAAAARAKPFRRKRDCSLCLVTPSKPQLYSNRSEKQWANRARKSYSGMCDKNKWHTEIAVCVCVCVT